VEEAVREPKEGELLVEMIYISLDPAMRGWMNERRSYVPGVAIGEVMRALALGKVVGSKNAAFAAGDHVYGPFGVQEYAITNGQGITKVDPKIAPLPVYLGALGMPGMTAYFALLETGELKTGDVVVMSAAAGAVGSVAGQIAKIKGCPVVGIVGGPEKCRFVKEELGFDAAIDYKSEDVTSAIAQHCPKGVDVYFDNVGGEILEAALANLALRGRVVLCGAISQYNTTAGIKGPSNYLSLLINRGTMRGMIVFDFAARYGEAAREMAGWIRAGKLKTREDIVQGFETFPETLQKLYKGENLGKLILKVGEE
jgi:NADPH-dependent curcumin reductase CurA